MTSVSTKFTFKNVINLTISSERSQEGGGGNPPHLIRNLTLENCDLTQLNYQAWATRKH